MSKETDMLCPWCGGELPGKAGQYVKCRHCGSDIHWGDDGKPYKTRFLAAQPNPVVRDVPVKLKPTPRVPIEIENESGPESSFVMEDVSEIIGELHAYEKADTQRKQIVASRYDDDISWREWWTECPLWQKVCLVALPFFVTPVFTFALLLFLVFLCAVLCESGLVAYGTFRIFKEIASNPAFPLFVLLVHIFLPVAFLLYMNSKIKKGGNE